jgi:hypothetical protein
MTLPLVCRSGPWPGYLLNKCGQHLAGMARSYDTIAT